MKGGYKIIDFKNVSLSGTPVTMTDVLVDLLNNYEKVVLLSHVVLSGSAKDDCFSTVLSDGAGGVKLNCYDGYISINSSGAVTYTVASTSEMNNYMEQLKTSLTPKFITIYYDTDYVVPSDIDVPLWKYGCVAETILPRLKAGDYTLGFTPIIELSDEYRPIRDTGWFTMIYCPVNEAYIKYRIYRENDKNYIAVSADKVLNNNTSVYQIISWITYN